MRQHRSNRKTLPVMTKEDSDLVKEVESEPSDEGTDYTPRSWTKEDLENPLEAHFKDFCHIHDINDKEDQEMFLYVFMYGAKEALSTLKFGIIDSSVPHTEPRSSRGYALHTLLAEACITIESYDESTSVLEHIDFEGAAVN